MCHSPDGKLLWQLNALFFVDSADFDPATDGRDLYAPFKHLTLDYARTSPGGEWSLAGYNWNRFTYGPKPPKTISSQVRRLGNRDSLVAYMTAQGTVKSIEIVRYVNDLAIPCGRMTPENNEVSLWHDANGDGVEQPQELTSKTLSGNLVSFHADSHGDLWTAWNGPTAGTIRHFICRGVDDRGTPRYGLDKEKGDFVEFSFPSAIAHGAGFAPRLRRGKMPRTAFTPFDEPMGSMKSSSRTADFDRATLFIVGARNKMSGGPARERAALLRSKREEWISWSCRGLRQCTRLMALPRHPPA